MDLKDLFYLDGSLLKVKDVSKLREAMDDLIYNAVFTEDDEQRKAKFILIKEACKEAGAYPASIQELYEHMGKDYPGFTVPAMNIRGLTYDTSKAVFRKALKMDVGAMIFEIARSEIGYTKQRPLEYATVVLAAAVAEGFEGPVFIQGDHYQLVKRYYDSDPIAETTYIMGLVKESIEAEFYNIDIDSSTLVDLSKGTLKEQQEPNFKAAAEVAVSIREMEPAGITVSIGGEIGEIGKANSTPEELTAYLDGFNETFRGGKGLSKLSVQTGTAHGGVVLPDGSLAQVKIDFDTLKELSEHARKDYGLSGCVQHGASTLPDEAFDMFPKTGTSEVHLATGFQNITYDNPALPADFRNEVYDFIKTEFAKEQKEGQTEEQFLPKEVKEPIMKELEDKFGLLFEKLKVGNTTEIVQKTITNKPLRKILPEEARALLA
jgi:fructose/tagatose bisphosphate aldolase